MTELRARGLTKTYKVELPREDAFSSIVRFFSGRSPSASFNALENVSLSLRPGAALALCGHNGSGKTTLLKILAGITVPTRGSIEFRGRKACLLGFASILQDRLSVKENARLCAVFFEMPGSPQAAAETVMSDAGLAHLRNARVGELSTGMKLRLPYMAALASGADLFLIDEALAVGDSAFRARCLAGLADLKRRGAMLVFATHDMSIARRLADSALVLEAGRVVYDGPIGSLPDPSAAAVPTTGVRAALERIAPLYEELKSAGFTLEESPAASDEQLLLAHSPSWLSRLKTNDLSPEEEARLALPCSKDLLPLSWRMAGGTIAAARLAASSGSLGIFPPGGGHHAFPDRGEGFCPVNDLAVAARVLLAEGLVRRPAVIDLDAHQGNGTAFILADGTVKTFSAHKADGYPRNRVRSSMDADIPAGASDEIYLEAVKKGISDFLELAKPDFVFALCSADAYEKDALGGLKVSARGLQERDEFLFRTLAALKIPACLVLGGAYGPVDDSVGINLRTIKAAVEAFPSFGGTIYR